MRYKEQIISIVILIISMSCNAGLDWTTVHSRANCLNNESITWWYLHPYNWRVVSIHHHKQNGEQHHIDLGFNYTWRAHAIHWGESIGSGVWEVFGYHYLLEYSEYIPFDSTYANNCNIIDGW